ncbi:hypothetical protein ACQPYK_00810 [Streptosporangium sp. CA-135522]|uniref:hypothetical protein n=1 Tax=Streptosporangium sp. CA-135522 TaxID=3240072 RepID=UPI003D89FA24
MTSPDPAPAATESPGASRRLWIVLTAVLFVLATVLALAWPAGGLETAEEPIPQRRFGQTVTGERFGITPRKVSYVTADPAPKFGDPQPGRFLVIELDVTNLGHDTATTEALAEQLEITTSPGGALHRFKDRHTQFVVRDGGDDRDQLHPDLPEKVLIAYRVPERYPDPEHITMTFTDSAYGAGFQSTLSSWMDGEVLAAYSADLGRAG